MKTFSAILVCVALAGATSAVNTGPSEDDFYATDKMGAYHFGFNDGRIARQEVRSPEGVVRGAYSYVDSNGVIQTISYTADKYNGFVASGSSIPTVANLPEVSDSGNVVVLSSPGGVEDTAEVVAARAQHLEAVKRAHLGLVPSVPVPMPIGYTPEVAAARVQHLNTHAREVLRNRGELPFVYVSQPAPQYHPDYLPYVGL